MVVLSVSEAKARLNELARRVHTQHERITLTRNGTAEAVLMSVDDLQGLETTLEVLSDADSLARIAEALDELEQGAEGTEPDEVREQLRRRRVAGE
jgi:antitoxin YefM